MKESDFQYAPWIPCPFANQGDKTYPSMNIIPPTIEKPANYPEGWVERTEHPLPDDTGESGDGLPVNRQISNALHFLETNLVFKQQMGFVETEWSGDVRTYLNGYPKGAIVKCFISEDLRDNTYTKFRSLEDDNMVNPVNDLTGEHWAKISNSQNANLDLSNLTLTGLSNVNVFRKQVEMQPINSIGKILASGNYITVKAGAELVFNNGIDNNTGFCNNIIKILENDITRDFSFIEGTAFFILYALLEDNNNITLQVCRYDLYHETIDGAYFLQQPQEGTIVVHKSKNLAFIYYHNTWVNIKISKLGRIRFVNSGLTGLEVNNLISGLGINDIHFLGGLSFPSNQVIELASNFSSISVFIDRDGYAYCSMSNANYCRIDNGFLKQGWDYPDRSRGADVCIPVRRGQIVTVDSDTDNPGSANLYLILAQHEVVI